MDSLSSSLLLPSSEGNNDKQSKSITSTILPPSSSSDVPQTSKLLRDDVDRNHLKRKKNKEKQQRKKLRRALSKGSSRSRRRNNSQQDHDQHDHQSSSCQNATRRTTTTTVEADNGVSSSSSSQDRATSSSSSSLKANESPSTSSSSSTSSNSSSSGTTTTNNNNSSCCTKSSKSDSLSSSESSSQSPHPFSTVALDHCETPQLAYEHLNEFLKLYLKDDDGRHQTSKSRNSQQNIIWDPYYCDGTMKRIFVNNLGYSTNTILHQNQDFYKLISSPQTIPNHTMLITNPPYSDNHIDRLLNFCLMEEIPNQRPCCLLLPNWVSRRPNYTSKVIQPVLQAKYEIFYMTSSFRESYTYTMPNWVSTNDRPKHVLDDGQTTPYLSSWYIFAPPLSSLRSPRSSYLERLDALSKKKGSFSSSSNSTTTTTTTTNTLSQASPSWVVAKTIKGLKWKIDKVSRKKQNKTK